MRIALLSSFHRTRGFTLVEILVVIALVFMLLILMGMGTSSLVQSSRLSEAVVQVENALRLASQRAALEDREIEVRFYEIPDGPGNPAGYTAFKVLRYEIETDPGASGYLSPGGAAFNPQPAAVSELQRLPSGVVLHAAANFSTLLTHPSRVAVPATVEVDGALRQTRRVRFFPRGGTDLAPDVTWTLLLCDTRLASESTLPPNHVVLRIDPDTARISVYRPE